MRKLTLIAALGFAGFIFFAGVCTAQKSSPPNDAASTAGETWQKEFDDVCSQDAMAYSVAELKTLIQKCDALQPKLDQLDETRRKVYSRRLAQCRGLFDYVLESKQKEQK